MDTIGSRLKEYAKARCGSVKRLAEELGMRPDNLQKYTSRHEPGAKLLRDLASHGMNVHWLLTGVGSMFAEDAENFEKSREERGMLAVLKSIGVTDAKTLLALFNDLQTILATQDSLKSKLGGLISEPVARKRKKSDA